jgi:hypothetical protein
MVMLRSHSVLLPFAPLAALAMTPMTELQSFVTCVKPHAKKFLTLI